MKTKARRKKLIVVASVWCCSVSTEIAFSLSGLKLSCRMSAFFGNIPYMPITSISLVVYSRSFEQLFSTMDVDTKLWFLFSEEKESIHKWRTTCVIPRLKGIYCHKNKRRRSKNICFLLRTAERNYYTKDPYKFWIVRNRVLLSHFTVPPSPQRLNLSRHDSVPFCTGTNCYSDHSAHGLYDMFKVLLGVTLLSKLNIKKYARKKYFHDKL